MNLFIKTSSNLYIYWNIGSILMISMVIQIIFGFMLSMNYFSISNDFFFNSFMMFFNFNYGWMIRFFHSNMTSMIFILMFIHIFRSMEYKNYKNKTMWNSGIFMMLMLMMISFMGYSLIMNQMSYWASTVITNFIEVIPIFGNKLMLLIWGNNFINNILMNRFFSMHFMMSLLLMFLSMIHLMMLHIKKSSNPLNINNKMDQININPMLIFKDLLMLMLLLYMFIMMNMINPKYLNNTDNFNQKLIFKTPNHIEPEWYFLLFYSILRSNENKLIGLILMLFSISVWFSIPFINKTKFMSNKFFIMNKMINKMFLLLLMMMTFLGTKTSKFPYNMMTKILIMMYFFMFYLMYKISYINNL